MLIKGARARTECSFEEEQCGFRQRRGCMDEVIAIRQVYEKCLENEEYVFWPLWICKMHMIDYDWL